MLLNLLDLLGRRFLVPEAVDVIRLFGLLTEDVEEEEADVLEVVAVVPIPSPRYINVLISVGVAPKEEAEVSSVSTLIGGGGGGGRTRD